MQPLHDITLDQYGMTLATTEYTYDNAARVETVVMAGDTTFTYHYKGGTNLVSGIDVSFAGVTGNTLSTAYTYESNTDRLSGITATAGSNTVYNAGYTYNDNDQVTRVTTPTGTITSQYDPSTHRLSSITDLNGKTTQYAYDASSGLLTSVTQVASTGNAVTQKVRGVRCASSLSK